jgi:hypothetical protein
MAILLLLLQLLFGAAPSAAALIDGSFESLLTNWSVAGWAGVPAAGDYAYVRVPVMDIAARLRVLTCA